MLISKSKKNKIEKVVKKWYNAIIFKIVGPQDLAAQEKNELFDEGIINPHETSKPIIEEAYNIGRIRSPKNGRYEKADLNKFRIFDSRNYAPLTAKEKYTVKHVKESMGNYVTALRDNARSKIEGLINNSNEKLAQQTLLQSARDIAEDNVKKRKGLKEFARDLRDLTGDLHNDWERVAVTEMSSAFNAGSADAIVEMVEEQDEDDANVVCFVSKDAALCESCKRLYLTPSGEPKVYKLSELRANGTNYGVKASAYRPVIPPAHPRCRCSLVMVPKGFGFKKGTQSITFKSPDYDVYKEQNKEDED